MDSLLAARLGLTRVAPKTSAPVASPVDPAGNHKPAPAAAEGKISLDTHHKAHVAAHKQGDYASAKTHALNYANLASKTPGESASQPHHPPTSGKGATPPHGMAAALTPKKGY